MSTPNERTVPSPERNEELERFINYELNHWVDDFQEIEQENQDNIKIVCRMVAAFSARRATESMEKKVRETREKAIEECLSSLPKKAHPYADYDSLMEKMDHDIKSAWNSCITEMKSRIEALKSKPQ